MKRKNKRRHSSSSSTESTENISRRELLDRLTQLEKKIKRQHRSRSHTRHRKPRRRKRAAHAASASIEFPQVAESVYSGQDTIHNDESPNNMNRDKSPLLCDSVDLNPRDLAYADRNNDLGPHGKTLSASPPLVIKNHEQLPDDVIQILGEYPNSATMAAFNFHPALCSRWGHIIVHGLEKEERQKVLARHSVPDNMPTLTPPSVNPEVLPILSSLHAKRDASHVAIQDQLARGLSALGRATGITLESPTIPKLFSEALLSNLTDAGRTLADLTNLILLTR